MPSRLNVGYAGLGYLDRTAALESEEVRPVGARLCSIVTQSAGEALDLLLAGEVDCAEVPLASVLDGSLREDFEALPVFLNRASLARSFFGDRQVARLSDLAKARIGVVPSARTMGAWGRAVAATILPGGHAGATWTPISEESVVREIESGGLDFAVLPPSLALPGLAPAFESAERVDREVYECIQALPILTVVVIRRTLTKSRRWLPVALTDAFVEAKALGMRRHRYFGALSVGLPWLMSSLRKIDQEFGSDAFPYGLPRNLRALSLFAEHIGGLGQLDVRGLFAPETVPLPGVPDQTFYAVPLSWV